MIISAFMTLQEIKIGNNLSMFLDKVVLHYIECVQRSEEDLDLYFYQRFSLFYVDENWIIICIHVFVHARV